MYSRNLPKISNFDSELQNCKNDCKNQKFGMYKLHADSKWSFDGDSVEGPEEQSGNSGFSTPKKTSPRANACEMSPAEH